MFHAAFTGWAAIRTGVCLPILAIALASAPGSCSCRFGANPPGEFGWDFSDIEVLEAAAEGGTALELNLIERIAPPDDAKRLHDFGRDNDSSLARARELVDNAFRDAEGGLQAKWPKGKLTLRMIDLSLVAPLYDPAPPEIISDEEDVQRYDRDHLAESIEQLRAMYPDRAAALPEVEKLNADAEKAEEGQEPEIASFDVVFHFRLAYTDQRPAGEFKSKKELELALLSTDPMTATLRLVYEIVGPPGKGKDAVKDPVLALEVVTRRFEFNGERWKAADNAEPVDETS